MDATLPARLPFEVLDRVRDINRGPVDAGFLERAIEELPGRADERLAAQVFLIARLFAEQHERGLLRTFAKHSLGRILVKRAGGAALGRFAQRR